MEDFVLVAERRGWDGTQLASLRPPLNATCDVIVPLSRYDGDLGMRTRSSVLKQLAVDLPRSRVRVDGMRVTDAAGVVAATGFPRLCTQAVLAPIVEWYLHHDMVAHELPGGCAPLSIDVTHGGRIIAVHKRLALRTWSGFRLGCVEVTVVADSSRDSLVVSLASCAAGQTTTREDVPKK